MDHDQQQRLACERPTEGAAAVAIFVRVGVFHPERIIQGEDCNSNDTPCFCVFDAAFAGSQFH